MLRDRGAGAACSPAPAQAPPLPPLTGSVLDRVHSARSARVGYFDDSLPYVFVNHAASWSVSMWKWPSSLPAICMSTPNSSGSTAPSSSDGIDPALCDVVMSGRRHHGRPGGPHAVYGALSRRDAGVASCPIIAVAAFLGMVEVRAMGPLRLGVPAAPDWSRRFTSNCRSADRFPLRSGMDDIFRPQMPPLDAPLPPPSADPHTRSCILHMPSTCRSRGRSRCHSPTQSRAGTPR